jgi:hypothetical protein
MLDGSYFGDWTYPDSLLRACLAGAHYGLAAVWVRGVQWHFETAGLGEPLCEGMVRTANVDLAMTRPSLSLMGDPTLRLQVLDPPTDLRATARRRGRVALEWTPSAAPGAQYYVYRSSSPDGPFTRLSPAALDLRTFTDNAAPRGRKTYQVRALKLTSTGSGSFTNISQAAWVSLN